MKFQQYNPPQAGGTYSIAVVQDISNTPGGSFPIPGFPFTTPVQIWGVQCSYAWWVVGPNNGAHGTCGVFRTSDQTDLVSLALTIPAYISNSIVTNDALTQFIPVPGLLVEPGDSLSIFWPPAQCTAGRVDAIAWYDILA